MFLKDFNAPVADAYIYDALSEILLLATETSHSAVVGRAENVLKHPLILSTLVKLPRPETPDSTIEF